MPAIATTDDDDLMLSPRVHGVPEFLVVSGVLGGLSPGVVTTEVTDVVETMLAQRLAAIEDR